MALRKLTANLAERVRPSIPNNQTFDMVDAYSKYTSIDYKAKRSFVPIDSSDKSLQVIYDDWKKDAEEMSPMYREVGDRYKKPYLISRAAEDTERVSRFMVSPQGAIFNIKQFGLHLSQPKTHHVLAQQTRIWNPAQFLANVPGRAVGLHLPNHGLVGTNLNYEQVVNIANQSFTHKDPLVGNRMIKIWRELGYDQSFDNPLGPTKIDDFLDKIRGAVKKVRKFLGIRYSGKIIKTQSGIGGPKSLYGLGFTDIRSYSIGVPVDDVNTYDAVQNYASEYNDTNYSVLGDLRSLYYGGDPALPSLRENPGNPSATKTNGFGLGNLLTNKELTKYNNYQNINAMASRHSKNYNTKEGNFPEKKSETFNDFRKDVKVNYTVENIHRRVGIPNTGETDPIYESEDNNNQNDLIALKFTYAGEETPLQFRATIMGLSNNFSPEWNPTDYVGRPDSVYTYKGVKRAISFSFIVAAGSEKEMDTIYLKLNKLAGMTMPSYGDDGSGHMIGPITKLKLGNYINNEPGYISSLDFAIDDEFIWDVDREEPMYIRVNVTFDIIGKETPRRNILYFGKVAR